MPEAWIPVLSNIPVVLPTLRNTREKVTLGWLHWSTKPHLGFCRQDHPFVQALPGSTGCSENNLHVPISRPSWEDFRDPADETTAHLCHGPALVLMFSLGR